MFPSFYREIAGFSGLKPDWESCRFGRAVAERVLSSVVKSSFALGDLVPAPVVVATCILRVRRT
jgi:hypothetical protein